MKQSPRTVIGVPAEVRDKLRIVAAISSRSLAAEVTHALTGHVASFVDKHPELATELTLSSTPATRARR